MELLARTGVGRDINRHYYNRDEIDQALARPVVRLLLDLIRLRNAHPAFSGEFRLEDSADEVLEMQWVSGAHFARLRVDLRTSSARIEYSLGGHATGVFETGSSADSAGDGA